jgi:thioredoxin reductase (NADPH)
MIDIAIIGGGPAGLAAGLYAARGGAQAVLFEEVFVGGQAAKTHQIDNYPGFSEGIAGSELGIRMEQQAARFGLNIRYEPVKELDLLYPVKCVETELKREQARAIILCTGANPRKLGLKREEELMGRGVSYCATCDGAFFRGREVAVVGGGDTALSDALYLARFAARVYLIHRRDEFRGIAALQKAVRAESKIQPIYGHVVSELLGKDKLEGIRIRHVVTGSETQTDVAALFVAVGIEPRTSLVRGQLPLTASGYIQTDPFMRTPVNGVFAAGDARETPLRQVVTAVADGAVAATQALEYLSTLPEAANN